MIYIYTCWYCDHSFKSPLPRLDIRCRICNDINVSVKKYTVLDTYAGSKPFEKKKNDGGIEDLDNFVGDYGSYGYGYGND